jgi:hypothetical protein
MAASTIPIATYPVKLYYQTAAGTPPTFTELVAIKDFPDLGGAPESIETTTLSDAARTYIPGIQSQEQLTFTCNYIKDDYDTINALSGEQVFQVWFGATGDDGKYQFSGQIMAYITGAGVNEVVNMTVVITPSTAITQV